MHLNNNALAQRENADLTKEMSMFGAGDLARKKSQNEYEHFQRMLGASDSPEARAAKRFDAQLRGDTQVRIANANMEGMFGATGHRGSGGWN